MHPIDQIDQHLYFKRFSTNKIRVIELNSIDAILFSTAFITNEILFWQCTPRFYPMPS